MDELVIGDQRYISSKRAAEITGYAKDYIGQLCREGRVEARLVGRSWYVREAAIKDHRFGAENAPESDVAPVTEVETEKEWTSPKYEAEAVEELPVAEVEIEEPTDTARKMQEAWQAWFAQNKVEEEAPVEIEMERLPEPEPAETEFAPEEPEVQVPITRVEEPEPFIEPEPEIKEEKVLKIHMYEPAVKRRSYFGLRIALMVIALSTAAIGLVGTGFLGLPRLGLTASVSDYISGVRVVGE